MSLINFKLARCVDESLFCRNTEPGVSGIFSGSLYIKDPIEVVPSGILNRTIYANDTPLTLKVYSGDFDKYGHTEAYPMYDNECFLYPNESKFILLIENSKDFWLQDTDSGLWYYNNSLTSPRKLVKPEHIYIGDKKLLEVTSKSAIDVESKWAWAKDPLSQFDTVYIKMTNDPDLQSVRIAAQPFDCPQTLYFKTTEAISTGSIRAKSNIKARLVPKLNSREQLIITSLALHNYGSSDSVVKVWVQNNTLEIPLLNVTVNSTKSLFIDENFILVEGDELVIDSTSFEVSALVSADKSIKE